MHFSNFVFCTIWTLFVDLDLCAVIQDYTVIRDIRVGDKNCYTILCQVISEVYYFIVSASRRISSSLQSYFKNKLRTSKDQIFCQILQHNKICRFKSNKSDLAFQCKTHQELFPKHVKGSFLDI